jgi:hypothetical protein
MAGDMSAAMKSYWELIEPLFALVDTGNGAGPFDVTMNQVPHSAALLFAAHMTLAEVHNGGFLQLFWNNTGVLVPEAVQGFQMIGMEATAAIVTRATLLLGSPYPREWDDRWDALLAASGRDSDELERMFKNSNNFYLTFAEVTSGLPFDSLNQEFWHSAKNENGGFQDAATVYARLVSQGQ